MTKSKIDQQLERILSGDVSELLDNHHETPDGEEVEDITTTELVPIEFDQKETSLELSNKDIQEDYQFVRSNLYGLIGRSNAALELALRLSAMSENPRALEVTATLIRMSSDVSKELISVHREIEKSKGANSADGTKQPSGKYTQINNYYNSPEEAKEVSSFLDDLPDDDK